MSASREKKVRQEMAASGTPDPKKVRQEEERLKHRRTNLMYGIIAGVFVLVAAFLLLWNSNVIQRGTTAVTIDGTKYTAAEMNYYYFNTYNYWRNSQYASYLGLGNAIDRNTTHLNEMARSFVGVTEDMTWDEYLKQETIETLTHMTRLTALAEKENYTFTEEMQKQLDENLESLREAAKREGMSEAAYLKAVYGNTMTKATYVKMWKQYAIASAYDTAYKQSLTYTDSDREAYYQEHKDDLDVVSCEYILFNGNAPTTDADGKTIEPTDEDKEKAKNAAKDAAEAALERFNNGETLEEIATDYSIATYTKQDAATHSTSDLSKWLFDANRAEGDKSIVESDPNFYLAVFHSRSINDARTVNVRHILFLTDTSALDKDSETYEADVAAIQEAAKAKADEALQNWKDGEATEDSFAAMANELSEDPGSNTNGGLYENVSEGDMVESFDKWIFDEARKVGDTDVVETSYGYHVMYFVGDGLPTWKVLADNSLRNTEYNEWSEESVADAVINRLGGMKYVG